MQDTGNGSNFAKKPDEISILNLLLKAKEYLIYILNRSYFVFLFAALGSGYYGSKYFNIKKTYPGKVTMLFVPKDIAKENKSTILVYSRLVNSSAIVKEVLLEEIENTDKKELLINYYLDTYHKLKPEDLDSEIPEGFLFENNDVDNFSEEENYVFKKIIEKISTPRSDFGDGFITFSIEEGVGLITVNTSTPTEELTNLILDRLEAKFQNTFFDNIVQAEKEAFDELKANSDTLSTAYKIAYYHLNHKRNIYGNMLKDSSVDKNSWQMRRYHDDIIRLEAKAEVLKLEYMETLKQYKTAHLELKNNTPIIKVLDKTMNPIRPYRPSWQKAMIKGMFTGAGLVIFIIILKKIIQDILNEQGDRTESSRSHFSVIYQAIKKVLPYFSVFAILIFAFVFYLYWNTKLRDQDSLDPKIKTELEMDAENIISKPTPINDTLPSPEEIENTVIKNTKPTVEKTQKKRRPDKVKLQAKGAPKAPAKKMRRGVIITHKVADKAQIAEVTGIIKSRGYTPYQDEASNKTRIGIIVSYDSNEELIQNLEKARNTFNPKAWLLHRDFKD